MKSFIEICQMTQKEVKSYMKKYLASQRYKVIDEDGFLYAKGSVPVLLVAHMDTVHKNVPATISYVGNKISSCQGIGGDDRCGVFMISRIVKTLHCSVLLCEDEEIGGVGAGKFARTKYINDLEVNYMVELDRQGRCDAVFYSCDNPDFTKFITDNTDCVVTYGSFSDISTLMPASKLCGVNLSCGYYLAHTLNEYVMYDEMLHMIEVVKGLVLTKCDKPFEYKAKTYSKTSYNLGYGYNGYLWDYGRDSGGVGSYGCRNGSSAASNSNADIELDIELEAIIEDENGEEDILYATGTTKAECWCHLFLKNPDVCFSQVKEFDFR